MSFIHQRDGITRPTYHLRNKTYHDKTNVLLLVSRMTSQCHDMASRFVYILTRGKSNTLAPEDFVPLVQDVVDTHPGLSFLKEATEFHSRYVHTVSRQKMKHFFCMYVCSSYNSFLQGLQGRKALIFCSTLKQLLQKTYKNNHKNWKETYFNHSLILGTHIINATHTGLFPVHA